MEYGVKNNWGYRHQRSYLTYRHDERTDLLTSWETKRNSILVFNLKVYCIDTAQKTCTDITDQFQKIKNAI